MAKGRYGCVVVRSTGDVPIGKHHLLADARFPGVSTAMPTEQQRRGIPSQLLNAWKRGESSHTFVVQHLGERLPKVDGPRMDSWGFRVAVPPALQAGCYLHTSNPSLS